MAISLSTYQPYRTAQATANAALGADPLFLRVPYIDYESSNLANGVTFYRLFESRVTDFTVLTTATKVVLQNKVVEIPQAAPQLPIQLAYVKLLAPIRTQQGNVLTDGWIRLNNLDYASDNSVVVPPVLPAGGTPYWIAKGRTAVKVRATPSLAGKILASLNAGEYIGTSSGATKSVREVENGKTVTNVYQYFVTSYGTGWVRTPYITSVNPDQSSSSGGSTTTPTAPNPSTPVLDDDPQVSAFKRIDPLYIVGGVVLVILSILGITAIWRGKKKSK